MLAAYDDLAPRHRRLIATAVVAILLLSVVGTYLALTTHHSEHAGASRPRASRRTPQTAAGVARATHTLRPIAATADPDAFTVAVAHALFEWDTTSPIPLSDYTGRLVAVADPSGEESPGLVADLANYLPSPAAWAELRRYYTRQWIDIDSVGVPTLWPRAVAEAGPDGLPPGTTAYTVEGVRHRDGIWEDQPVSTKHDVAFTVFIVCRPSYPTCHLLRLSLLDDPLE